jgi:hypothetical protein
MTRYVESKFSKWSLERKTPCVMFSNAMDHRFRVLAAVALFDCVYEVVSPRNYGKGAKRTSGCIVHYHGTSMRCVTCCAITCFVSTSEVSAKLSWAVRGGVLYVLFPIVVLERRRSRGKKL